MLYNAKNAAVSIDGNLMEYIQFGNGKRNLVFLPGLGDGLRTVKGTAAIMAMLYRKYSVNHTVYMFSRKQHISPGSSTRDMAADLKKAMDTLEAYAYRVAKYIGSYVAAMNGVDAIAFTAGIGENTSFIREKILAYLGYLGITMDAEANKVRGEERVISTPDSKVTVCVIPTNEELAICRETVALVK